MAYSEIEAHASSSWPIRDLRTVRRRAVRHPHAGGQGPTIPLDHSTLRTRTILAIGLATAAPTVVTLWLVAERLRRLQPLLTAEAPLPDAGDRVDELRTLGRCSVRSLAAASVSVSLAVLLAGAPAALRLRPRILVGGVPGVLLLLYGAFPAAFAAVYMPTLLTWRSRAPEQGAALEMEPTPAADARSVQLRRQC